MDKQSSASTHLPEEPEYPGGPRVYPHPASFRPASLTVNDATPRNVSRSMLSTAVSITINPMEAAPGGPASATVPTGDRGGGSGDSSPAEVPGGSESPSPGTSQMSPPPSYNEIPGTVPVHQGVSRGPPPSYEDAVDPNAEPPSYDSLFGRIRDTHKASRNFIDFVVKLFILLIGTIGCTIACSITIVCPLCMIIIGSVYFNECPAEPYIPIFLIVGGSFSVFKYLIGVVTRIRRAENDTQEQNQSHPAQSLITCFLCGWFITGCVWVYRIYKPLMDEADRGNQDYCNRTVYIFAFWLITTAYIFLGLFTSCICCFSIASVILKREY